MCKHKCVCVRMLRCLPVFCALPGGPCHCKRPPFTMWKAAFCNAVYGLSHADWRSFIPPNGVCVFFSLPYSQDELLFFLLYSAVFAVPVLIFRHGKQTCFVWQNVACYAVSAYGCANKARWHNRYFQDFLPCYCSLFKCEYQQSDEIHTLPILIRQDILKKL